MKDINLFKTQNSIFLKKIFSKTEISKEDNCDGYLIESDEKEARRIIESLKTTKKIIAIIGGEDNFNRRIAETLKVDYLVSPEGKEKIDSLKQRDSGINHVVAKILAKKNVSIVINMKKLSESKREKRAKEIARIIQNIKICRKAKCQIKMASFGYKKRELVDEIARKSFGTTLGMSSVETRDSTTFPLSIHGN